MDKLRLIFPDLGPSGAGTVSLGWQSIEFAREGPTRYDLLAPPPDSFVGKTVRYKNLTLTLTPDRLSS
jgi:hypothetical protein